MVNSTLSRTRLTWVDPPDDGQMVKGGKKRTREDGREKALAHPSSANLEMS